MRLVKAAKASPHAKFYNLSTGWRGPLFSRTAVINYNIVKQGARAPSIQILPTI